jgi:thiamine phosphate synthase YjbQ (UPF0047 family)
MTAEEELMQATRQLENVLRNYTGGFALGLLYTIRSSAAALLDEGYAKAQQDIYVDLDATYHDGYSQGYNDGMSDMQARAEGWN